MKTVTKPTAAPGCCGPVGDRVEILRKVHINTAQAHAMLAQIYETLMTDFPDEAEDFRKAAATQRELAEMSKNATIPDAFVAKEEAKAAVKA